MEFLVWQISEIGDARQLISFGFVWIFIFIIFAAIYQIEGKQFIKIDGDLTPKEEKIYFSIFVVYFAWGLIQQLIVLGVTDWGLGYIGAPVYVQFMFAVSGFSLAHLPNLPLVRITATLGFCLYVFYFYLGFESFVYIALTHSLGGTLLKFLGFDMRVLWKLPREKRWIFTRKDIL